jgi:hypothetical protein
MPNDRHGNPDWYATRLWPAMGHGDKIQPMRGENPYGDELPHVEAMALLKEANSYGVGRLDPAWYW